MAVPAKDITISGKTYRIGQLTVPQARDMSEIGHQPDFNLRVIAMAMNNASADEPYTAERLSSELPMQTALELFMGVLEFSGMPVSPVLSRDGYES
jgi:hypothetical protein